MYIANIAISITPGERGKYGLATKMAKEGFGRSTWLMEHNGTAPNGPKVISR